MSDAVPVQNQTKPAPVTGAGPQSVGAEHPWPWRWISALAIVLIIGGGLFYYQPFTTKPAAVTFETAAAGPVTRVLAVNGRIAATHSVDVRAQVSGTIAALPVVEGASVQAGDVLAQIDPTAQEAKMRQSRASLDAGHVAETLANANYTRLAALKGVVTRTSIETAQSNAQSASEDVRRLTALLDQAEIELAKFTILAPISGTVISVEGETGQLTDPAKALVTLADLNRLIVETDVDEAYSTQIKAEMPAVLQLVGEDVQRSGRVNFVAPNVNAATGGLEIKIGFDEPVSAPIGLTVTMNIVVDEQERALTVPRAAILTEAGVTSLFVLENGSMARKRTVIIIDWPADRLIVTRGLAPGEAVILEAAGLIDGQNVTATAATATTQKTATDTPIAVKPAAAP